MNQPVTRSWKHSLEPVHSKSFFESFIDSIIRIVQRVFNPSSLEQRVQKEIRAQRLKVAGAVTWDRSQLSQQSIVTRKKSEKPTTDPIDHFFEEFFYNIVVSFFEAQLIEQVRNIISRGVSDIMIKDAEKVSNFLIGKMETLDIHDKNTELLIDRAIEHYLGDNKSSIQQALDNCGYTESPRRLIKNCTVQNIRQELGNDKVYPFVQALMKILLPKWLTGDRFLGHLNHSIYNNFRAVIDLFINDAPDLKGDMEKFSDVSKISPILKAVARIGSRLVGQRLSFFFKNMNIKDMLDKAVVVGRDHLKAHISAIAISKMEEDDNTRMAIYNDEFAKHYGCHQSAKGPIRDKPTLNDPLVQEFSSAFVDFVLDDDTIKKFVEGLRQERDEILYDVTNPFVIGLIDELIKKENGPILAKALINFKPLVKEGFIHAVNEIGFNKLFHRESIYRILYVYIAPAISDVIQRVMIKKLVFTQVNNKNDKFINNLRVLYENYYINSECDIKGSDVVLILTELYRSQAKCHQGETIIKRLPDLIEVALKEFMDPMKKKGWAPAGVNNQKIEDEIKSYFREDFSEKERVEYGELLMTLIFQLPKKNIAVKLTNDLGIDKSPLLTDIFTSLFLNGVYDLRGVDKDGNPINDLYPYKEFFKLIEGSIKPYENPEVVRQLFQNTIKPWDASIIKTETEREAAQFADILYDLIRFSAPYGVAPSVDWAVWGLDKQLKYVLLQFFGNSEVNYNLLFHVLDILKNQVEVVKKAENMRYSLQ